ncbi:MAG: hypothetical protein CVV31_01765 [Methanomicrobiales archaeon HGW-Methanomicrobiales-2]|jgi:predicted ribosomally synthesized peptide with SipW-like signal peptide|nr:MAG: hypothetical protein CVV31_01765 [Methanomicrobiales archaeon HGW-Methanomicrobiales-2]
MKAYLVSILLVGLALGGMGLGTFAWFTDQEAVENNVVQTGNADLVVWTYNANGAYNQPLSVSGVAPSVDEWTDMGYIGLWNKGSTDLKWQGYLVRTAGDLSMDKFQIKLTTNPESYGSKYAPGSHLWGDDGKMQEFAWSQVNTAADTLLTAIEEPMEPGYYQVFKVEAKLDPSAGNAYADKSATLKVVFDATQFANSGWTEAYVATPA